MDVRTLAQIQILDLEGNRVPLGDEWRDWPAVVVWLRHFGCMFCKEQAKAFRTVRGEIEDLGARLVFVGNGEVRWARGFADEYCEGCRVLTDPQLSSYRAIGARRGGRSMLDPRILRNGVRALLHGNPQTRILGPAGQQGGVLVVLPGDEVAYAYLSEIAGDHPPAAEVLAALRAAVERRADLQGRAARRAPVTS